LNKSEVEKSYRVHQVNEYKAKIAALEDENIKIVEQSTAQMEFLTYKVQSLEDENNRLLRTI